MTFSKSIRSPWLCLSLTNFFHTIFAISVASCTTYSHHSPSSVLFCGWGGVDYTPPLDGVCHSISSCHLLGGVGLRWAAGGVDWLWGEAQGSSASISFIPVIQYQRPPQLLSPYLYKGVGFHSSASYMPCTHEILT